MSKENIHPQAVIEPGAKIGKNVVIEPYAVIKKNVTLGDNVVVMSHAYIDGNTTIGNHTKIYTGAAIGNRPQSVRYKGEETYVEIGEHCEIREFVTINSSIGEKSSVKIGSHTFIMAYCHIAHNSEVGNHVIMSNNATLAGHVSIEDYAIIGGMTPIHQFVRIGCHAMVGGLSRVGWDVPPYTIGAGIPFKFGGLNLIGLKRRGFDLETRRQISHAFRLMYRSGLKMEQALSRIEQECDPIPEIQHWIEFCRGTKRGIMGIQKLLTDEELDNEFLEESKTTHDIGIFEVHH